MLTKAGCETLSLDTDHLSLFERGHARVTERLLQTPYHELGITIITAEEQMRGRLAHIRSFQSDARKVEQMFQAYQWLRETIETIRSFFLLDYDIKAHQIFLSLRQQKLRIGAQDLRIAAIALSVSGILVTRNVIDFGQIPGLMIEDWTK